MYVTAPGRDTPIQLTDDATVANEGEGLSYHRLSWSPGGRLAFASVRRAQNDAESTLYVVDDPTAPARVVAESDRHFVIYAYWSPIPCPDEPDCRHLAYLIEEEDGIALRLLRLDSDGVKNKRVGVGGPVYVSWAPDGRRLLWHTGNARRRNPEARVMQYDLGQEEGMVVSARPGRFQAPAWSPQGGQWLGVTGQDGQDRLQRFTGDGTHTLATADDRFLNFVWSPDGTQIAYAISERDEEIVYGPIHLIDLADGSERQLTGSFRVEGFFWSPDGHRLAYLARTTPAGELLQWRVYDVTNDEDRGYTMFTPTGQMRFLTSSFNQYAQSHRLWSPDSRYLVYSDRDDEDVKRIWLVDTHAPGDADPIFIAEGSLAVWSWQ